MSDEFWIAFAAAFAVFLLVEAVLLVQRSRSAKNAREYLRLAKRETLETARLALDNPYPLVQVAQDGSILFVNPAAFACFPGIREQGANHPVLQGIEAEGASSVSEVTCGDIVYNRILSRTSAGGQGAIAVYFYDVTERKAQERLLRESREEAVRARAEAEKANRARGDFLANMSHELRTPMNGIIALSGILAEADLRPEHKELAEAVNGSGRNLLILLNDILDFSKIEAGELTLESIPFDLRKIIRQIEALQKPAADDKGLAFICEIAENVPQLLSGDPARLQQILNNLTTNALKFTEQGSVTISAAGECYSDRLFHLHLAVTDTGIGIPPEKQGKLFKKFQQADLSTSRKYGGTGLGLSICKTLAELMGGEVSLRSVEGQGSTFTVRLPMKIAEPSGIREAEGDREKSEAASLNTGARLLVVDDHPINRLVMRQSLLKMGFENFDEAEGGAQALALAGEHPYDLILMDCQMPDMDGYETSRRLRELDAGTGNRTIIVAVTANAMQGAVERCAAAGMDDYISKPVDRGRLLEVLTRRLPAAPKIMVRTAAPKKPPSFFSMPPSVDGSSVVLRAPSEGAGTLPPASPLSIPVSSTASQKEKQLSAVFDWGHLTQFTNGDAETERVLLEMFLENLALDMARLEDSFRTGNFVDWEATAHKLHGASAHMGAQAMAEACDHAQFLSPEDGSSMENVHSHILQEAGRLRRTLAEATKAA